MPLKQNHSSIHKSGIPLQKIIEIIELNHLEVIHLMHRNKTVLLYCWRAIFDFSGRSQTGREASQGHRMLHRLTAARRRWSPLITTSQHTWLGCFPIPQEREEEEQIKVTYIPPALNIQENCFYPTYLIPPWPSCPIQGWQDPSAQVGCAGQVNSALTREAESKSGHRA